MLIAKIGMVLNIAKFTYGIIKDIKKVQKEAQQLNDEKQVKQAMTNGGFKIVDHHVGKAVKQQQKWAAKKQKDGK